jgi:hypothetical protein
LRRCKSCQTIRPNRQMCMPQQAGQLRCRVAAKAVKLLDPIARCARSSRPVNRAAAARAVRVLYGPIAGCARFAEGRRAAGVHAVAGRSICVRCCRSCQTSLCL